MTEVVMTRDDRVEPALIEALQRIPVPSLLRGRFVAAYGNLEHA